MTIRGPWTAESMRTCVRLAVLRHRSCAQAQGRCARFPKKKAGRHHLSFTFPGTAYHLLTEKEFVSIGFPVFSEEEPGTIQH
jgi:hypothetical protein